MAYRLEDSEVLARIAENPSAFMFHNDQWSTKKIKGKASECYKIYTKRFKRKPVRIPIPEEVKQIEGAIEAEQEHPINTASRTRKSTRSRSCSSEISIGSTGTLPESKKAKTEQPKCDICHRRSEKPWPNEVLTLYRVSEMKEGDCRASRFLSAMKYNNDEITKKYIYCTTVGDIYAADVMYHGNCMTNYLKKYERNVNQLIQNMQREDYENYKSDGIEKLLNRLDFEHQAYSITDITRMINKELSLQFDNRRAKGQLIKCFGEKLSFSYSTDRSKPQIVFRRKMEVGEVIEGTLREQDCLKDAAKLLSSEIRRYSFNLDKSRCLPEDLQIALDRFTENKPKNWTLFVSELFRDTQGCQKNSEIWNTKVNTSFQFFYYWITKKITPMHCGLTQMIHCLSKSRKIIDSVCRLGFGISYDYMKRIDTGIAEEIVDKTGDNRGPVGDSIVEGCPIQGAVDNFNHQERTATGGDVSNDTVLVIWQNKETPDQAREDGVMSVRPDVPAQMRKRKLVTQLPCQQLLLSRLIKKTGKIAEGFVPITSHKHRMTMLKKEEEDYFNWFFLRNSQHESASSVPSFIATNSKLLSELRQSPKITAVSFYPILPYPATSMDSIYTSMVNFLDVLKQKGERCGALWCDEGVYCLAKEIQLLNTEKFGNLFIALGPFHWSKILMGAIGKWLTPSGIGDALVNSGIFSSSVAASSVLQGGDYVKAKDGLNIIAEAILMLQYEEYLKSDDYLLKKDSLDLDSIEFDVDQCISYFSNHEEDSTNNWELLKTGLQDVKRSFEAFKESQRGNKNFEYWDMFLNFMFPCLRDFEVAVRTGNWDLFLSAVERSLFIFFGLGKHNYSRYGPLFYQDCLDIQRTFPEIYRHFKQGYFVCHMSTRYASGIGFDQGLEKAYNHTAKAVGGIIGMTRRKESVALWDIIKHKKDLFVAFIEKSVNIQEDANELNLHHEFSPKTAQATHERVRKLASYIKSVQNPFTGDGRSMHHLTTGEAINATNAELLVRCVDNGKENYQKFINERLVDKTKGLHDTISFKFDKVMTETSIVEKVKKERLTTDEQENDSVMSYLQYALSRGITEETLLKYPLTSRPVYLLEKNSLFQKKATKGELSKCLLQLIDKDAIITGEFPGRVPCVKCTAVAIDFMSVVRRFSSAKIANIKTFGDFCHMVLSAICSYGQLSEHLYVVFENYSDASIKAAERTRRLAMSGSSDALKCDVVSGNQILPPSFQEFFHRTSNKISLQNFFVDFSTTEYNGKQPLILAGGRSNDPEQCWTIIDQTCVATPELRASHEEADDRLMFTITKIVEKSAGPTSITVVSPDADILVTLLYHLKNTWQGLKLYLLKKGRFKEEKIQQNELYPLNEVISRVTPRSIVDYLPAGHALTGCDSVGKVGTKASLMKVLATDGELLENFGLDALDEEGLNKAESFLAKVVGRKGDDGLQSFDALRTRAFLQSKEAKFTNLPCSSNEIHQNIKRACYQTRLWLESVYGDGRDVMNVESYGYTAEFAPTWFNGSQRPPDLPEPCKGCTTCVRSSCPCRRNNVGCTKYCKCYKNCKNPLNKDTQSHSLCSS